MSEFLEDQKSLIPDEFYDGERAVRGGRGERGDRDEPTLAELQPPANVAQLRRFVEYYFGLRLAHPAVCPHHDSPLDYLAASFFGQDDLLVWANRGGGKTLIAAAATILDALFRAPTQIRVLGGSFDQSDRLADYIRTILDCYPNLVAGRATRQRVELINGSDIRMLAQSQRAVRGQHVQKIRCDEVDLFDPDVWRAVQFATRSTSRARGSIEVLSTLHRPGGLMHKLVTEATRAGRASGAGRAGEAGRATEAERAGGAGDSGRASEAGRAGEAGRANNAGQIGLANAGHRPGRPGGYRLIHWCLWDVIERCGPDRKCGTCPLADDCRGIARRASGYFSIDDAIAIKSRSSRAAWQAEMLCTGVRSELAVFGQFDRARHVRPLAYHRDWPTYRAIDFGYANPLVCLWVQLSPAGVVHVLDEYVRSRRPIARHAVEMLKRDPGPVAMTYVDPAGNSREAASGAACTELLAAAGIPCTWRRSSVAEGIELVRAALAPADGPARLLIDPRCGELISAFESYHYGEAGRAGGPGGIGRAKPVKDGPDHAIDALRYFFVNRFRPKISVTRGRY